MSAAKKLEWFTRLFTTNKLTEVNSKLSPSELLHRNSINRRKSQRIKFPQNVTLSRLPQVFIKDKLVQIADISLGGVCIIDNFNLIGEEAGGDLDIKVLWPQHQAIFKSTVVMVSYQRRHLKIHNIDSKTFILLGESIRSGYLGSKVRRILTQDIKNDSNPIFQIWCGYATDHLTLRNDLLKEGIIAELEFDGNEILFYYDSPPIFRKSINKIEGQRINIELFEEIILYLVNIQNPTIELNNYIEIIQAQYIKYYCNLL